MSNVKNYTEQGGEKTVIGGTLEFTDDAKVVNMPGGGSGYVLPPASYDKLGGIKVGGGLYIHEDGTLGASIDCPADHQEDSTATTVAALKDDFNALLAKLKGAGLMIANG